MSWLEPNCSIPYPNPLSAQRFSWLVLVAQIYAASKLLTGNLCCDLLCYFSAANVGTNVRYGCVQCSNYGDRCSARYRFRRHRRTSFWVHTWGRTTGHDYSCPWNKLCFWYVLKCMHWWVVCSDIPGMSAFLNITYTFVGQATIPSVSSVQLLVFTSLIYNNFSSLLKWRIPKISQKVNSNHFLRPQVLIVSLIFSYLGCYYRRNHCIYRLWSGYVSFHRYVQKLQLIFECTDDYLRKSVYDFSRFWFPDANVQKDRVFLCNSVSLGTSNHWLQPSLTSLSRSIEQLSFWGLFTRWFILFLCYSNFVC